MKYGYVRVSTDKQSKYGYSLEYQQDAVRKAGAEQVLIDKAKSGKNLNRPQFETLQIALHPGDTVIVNSLDRLSRSFKDLITITDDWNKRGIKLIALKEGVDTSSQIGITYLQIMSSIAELERRMIVERTEAGRQKAIAMGKIAHRKPTWTDKDALKALDYKQNKGFTNDDLTIKFKCSIATVFRMLSRAKQLQKEANNDNKEQ